MRGVCVFLYSSLSLLEWNQREVNIQYSGFLGKIGSNVMVLWHCGKSLNFLKIYEWLEIIYNLESKMFIWD